MKELFSQVWSVKETSMVNTGKTVKLNLKLGLFRCSSVTTKNLSHPNWKSHSKATHMSEKNVIMKIQKMWQNCMNKMNSL